MKLKRIKISGRIDLWFNNGGFRFTLSSDKPEGLDKWNTWCATWPLYRRDGIITKVSNYLRGCSDHNKDSVWYRELNFQENTL